MKDFYYLIAFALGMAFLWLSGHAGIAMAASHPGLKFVVNILAAGAVYGLGAMLTVYLLGGRKFLPALLCGLVAIIVEVGLTFGADLFMTGHIVNKRDLGLVLFVLYIFFGGLYPALLASVNKLSRRSRRIDPALGTSHN